MTFLALLHPGHGHASILEALFHAPWAPEIAVTFALAGGVAWRLLHR